MTELMIETAGVARPARPVRRQVTGSRRSLAICDGHALPQPLTKVAAFSCVDNVG